MSNRMLLSVMYATVPYRINSVFVTFLNKELNDLKLIDQMLDQIFEKL